MSDICYEDNDRDVPDAWERAVHPSCLESLSSESGGGSGSKSQPSATDKTMERFDKMLALKMAEMVGSSGSGSGAGAGGGGSSGAGEGSSAMGDFSWCLDFLCGGSLEEGEEADKIDIDAGDIDVLVGLAMEQDARLGILLGAVRQGGSGTYVMGNKKILFAKCAKILIKRIEKEKEKE